MEQVDMLKGTRVTRQGEEARPGTHRYELGHMAAISTQNGGRYHMA